MGDGGLYLGGSVTSSRKGLRVLMQARLDSSERVWLQGALEGCCLKAAAGYNDGKTDCFSKHTLSHTVYIIMII